MRCLRRNLRPQVVGDGTDGDVDATGEQGTALTGKRGGGEGPGGRRSGAPSIVMGARAYPCALRFTGSCVGGAEQLASSLASQKISPTPIIAGTKMLQR